MTSHVMNRDCSALGTTELEAVTERTRVDRFPPIDHSSVHFECCAVSLDRLTKGRACREARPMCGIVGYTGRRQASPILTAGLRRLEYRGYDSAGVAVLDQSRLRVRKQVGRVDLLEKTLQAKPANGTCGISHTRWATHGVADDTNAHPHIGGDGAVALVHNGVIENHQSLRDGLRDLGIQCQTQTDTEVVAHWIAEALRGTSDLLEAVLQTLPRLQGTYGLAVVSPTAPSQVICARRGSPIVVGLGDQEHFVASDPAAIGPHTRRVAYLEDGEVAQLTPDHFEIRHIERGPVVPRIDRIDWEPDSLELGRFDHYMQKEIHEQPATVQDACRGRFDFEAASARFESLNIPASRLRRVRRIIFAACGTSLHAALIGEYLIERLARIPAEVEYASEFRYRNAPLDDRSLVLVLSQSGETADTLAGLREATRRGFPAFAICNVPGSTIAREADGALFLHAGTEIGVASTKTFTAQVTVLSLLALYLGRLRGLSHQEGSALLFALQQVPELIGQILDREHEAIEASEAIAECRNALYLGRDLQFPVALEGALKVKEISYLHAEGYPTAELKHGPLALVDPETPSIFVAPTGSLHTKTLGNIQEVRARRGPIIAVSTEEDDSIRSLADHLLQIPNAMELIQPLLSIVPLQLLAYHVARYRGCNIDKPRNLAKSVTVE